MKKLRYDKDKLDFVEDHTSIWDYIKKGLWLLLASLGLSVLYYFIFAVLVNTDEEKMMITETRAIQEEYQSLENDADRLEKVVSGLEQRDKELYNSIFNSDPPDITTTFSHSDTSIEEDYDETDYSFGQGLIKKTNSRLARMSKRQKLCENYLSLILDTLSNENRDFKAIPSLIPVQNFSLVQTGASTGMKVHPFYKKLVMHHGIDLVIPIGTQVRVSADGVVRSVSRSQKEKGNCVEVDHGNGYVTVYSHLGDIYVNAGQALKQGVIIARVGTSGTSFAPHLHYEVKLNGKYVDPINYFFAEISPADYKKMMLIAVNTGQSLD